LTRRTLVVDFDGTVTQEDLLDEIASRFGDPVVYKAVDEGLDEGRIALREVITREFEPVRKPLEEIVGWELENVRIRPGFRELVELAQARGWRFVIVSSGFHELIEPILEREGVSVELHANRVDPRPDGWRVLWQYDQSCEFCGESCKRSIVQEFAGDGELVLEVSDELCPWNAYRFALDGSTTKAAPDLRLEVDALGSVYLGGFTFADLARAGRIEEVTPGAVARADALFRTDRKPWCPEIF